MASKANSSSGTPPPPSSKRGSSSAEHTRSAVTSMPHTGCVAATAPALAPCGACKFLRRKCVGGCVFAPHFGTEQGAARFAAVHKVFGASNVSKLLSHIPAARRHDAVVTICYEAQARLSDPVYGCVATILALQHQVASLQAELSIVQSQLINSRLAMANAIPCSQQQQMAVLQPSYSNNSSTSNHMVIMSGFQAPVLDLSDSGQLSRSIEPQYLLWIHRIQGSPTVACSWCYLSSIASTYHTVVHSAWYKGKCLLEAGSFFIPFRVHCSKLKDLPRKLNVQQ